ncbi:hypothetical protein BDZ89DRAFT_1043698 [Hymenopellis radicata]|nr:hypothetical protein BDZ89DRAFT_1043698 [Hymenopellis radicata]
MAASFNISATFFALDGTKVSQRNARASGGIIPKSASAQSTAKDQASLALQDDEGSETLSVYGTCASRFSGLSSPTSLDDIHPLLTPLHSPPAFESHAVQTIPYCMDDTETMSHKISAIHSNPCPSCDPLKSYLLEQSIRMEDERSCARNQHSRYQAFTRDLMESLRSFDSVRDQIRLERDSMEARLNEVIREKAVLLEAYKDYKQATLDLQSEVAALKMDRARLERERAALRARLDSADQAASEAENLEHAIQKSNRLARLNTARLRAEMSALRDQLSQTQAELSVSRSKCKILELDSLERAQEKREREEKAREERKRRREEEEREKRCTKALVAEEQRCRRRDRDQFGVGDGPWTDEKALKRSGTLLKEFQNVTYTIDGRPPTIRSIPWPVLVDPREFQLKQLLTGDLVGQFLRVLKSSLNEEHFRSHVMKLKVVFHPDKWQSRSLLKTVLDDSLKKELETAGNAVSQAVNAFSADQ